MPSCYIAIATLPAWTGGRSRRPIFFWGASLTFSGWRTCDFSLNRIRADWLRRRSQCDNCAHIELALFTQDWLQGRNESRLPLTKEKHTTPLQEHFSSNRRAADPDARAEIKTGSILFQSSALSSTLVCR